MNDVLGNSGGVNFLPEDYVEQRVQGRWNIICIGLIVIVFMGVVAGVFVQQKVMAKEAADLDQVNEKYIARARQIEQFNELEAKRTEMIQKFQVSLSLLEPVPRSKLLEQLTKLLPKGVDLLGMELRTQLVPGPALPPVQQAQNKLDPSAPAPAPPPPPMVREVTVSLSGFSVNDQQVATLISNLSNSPLMTDVNLAYSEEYAGKEEVLRRFKVDMKLANSVDLKKLASNLAEGSPAGR